MQQPVHLETQTIGPVPTLIVAPQGGGPYPVVVALHGLTGNKETMLPLAQPLAAAGYIVVCPDARFHGERLDPAWMQALAVDETAAVARCVAETAGDLPGLLNTLLARPDARPTHAVTGSTGIAGIMGVSLGALTLYDAVPREPRFGVAVGIIPGGIFPRDPAAEAQMPPEARAMMDARDLRNHLYAFTHVALLLLAGEFDQRLPTATTQALYDALAPQMPDPARLRLVVEPGIGHEVTPLMGMEMVGWFRRYLT